MGFTRQEHIDVHHSDECRAKFMSKISMYDSTICYFGSMKVDVTNETAYN